MVVLHVDETAGKRPVRRQILGMRRLLVGLLALSVVPVAGPALLPASASADEPSPVVMSVLGNRADLVSAGDALVEVRLPAGASAPGLRVQVNGRDVSRSFATRTAGSVTGRVVGLVDGLRLGANSIRAVLPDGRGAVLEVTSSPRGGPVFSGRQVQPWVCTTEAAGLGAPQDEHCNGSTTYRFVYKNAATGVFLPYDPEAPPPSAGVATTTTDEGNTVPYIVRIERGTLNRAIYDIAVLFAPGEPLSPWQPQPGWNRKLVYSFGGGCAPGHTQGAPQDPLIDRALKRGFGVAVSSINVAGNVCNFQVQAETVMMVKERITEQYGEIRYTIGNGCSGGAEAQNTIAEGYPGLLDGIRPECTFADGWSPAILSKSDCALLERYFTRTSPALWPRADQRGSVLGNPTDSHCLEMQALRSAPEDWDPTTGCKLDAETTYHPVDNPDGVRCTLQDYHRAQLGVRPSDGFANGILDDVGIQWGLGALLAGDITVAQFVDLNEKVGGWTIDHQPQATRTSGDLEGIRSFYRSGQFTFGLNLAMTPTIDARTDNTADFHGNIHREVVRARQSRHPGGTAAQAYWTEPVPGAFGLPTPPMAERTFVVMDHWLAQIEQDTAPGTRLEKVLRNKPEEAVDGCFVGGQPAPQSACDAGYTEHSLARLVAGMPKSADVLKCQLKPLDRTDYPGVTFDDTQWKRLQAAHPAGVCDWSRPGVGQSAPLGSWMTFTNGAPGRPLPAAPVSRPFGAGNAVRSAPGSDGSGLGRVLPATGPSPAAAAAGLLLVALLLANRRLRNGADVRRPAP